MTAVKKLSIVIMDRAYIHDINHIVVKHSNTSAQSSSHVLFDVEPVNMTDIAEDLTFFTMSAEDEASLDNKVNDLIEELNTLNTDYSIRNMETNNFYTTIESVGRLSIKFDNLKILPKGTYKKIDALKNIKTEFGYCKGFKPTFRRLEGNSIENLEVKDENIYLFTNPEGDMSKLIEHLSEKVMEINPDFYIETKIFI